MAISLGSLGDVAVLRCEPAKNRSGGGDVVKRCPGSARRNTFSAEYIKRG